MHVDVARMEDLSAAAGHLVVNLGPVLVRTARRTSFRAMVAVGREGDVPTDFLPCASASRINDLDASRPTDFILRSQRVGTAVKASPL